jgi:FkbM family methyltransferase
MTNLMNTRDLNAANPTTTASEVQRLTLRDFLAQRVDQVTLRIKRMLGIREKMRMGATELILSPGHTLALNQRHHPLYDRFLPHLASMLEPGSMVIDVGANCGDTLGAMHGANPSLGFIAVEPHEAYFALLEQNVAAIAAKRPLNVRCVKALVSCGATEMTLVKSGGTAHAVISSEAADGMRTQTLDAIVAALGVDKVRVLKSDVDGFDYDVLKSARHVLAQMQPLVFFEAQVDHAFQRDGFAESLSMLAELGYDQWVLFDNFGSVALRTDSRDAVLQLIDYTWKKRTATPWRTIYYFDVLVGAKPDHAFIDNVIDAYERATVA